MAAVRSLPWGGVAIIAVGSITLFLAIVAVIARFYTRKLLKKALSVDDYLICVGLLFTAVTNGIGFALVTDGGVGLHMEDCTEQQIANALKLFVVAPIVWAFATLFVKLSILFFYLTIFGASRIHIAVYTVITLTMGLLIVVLLEAFLLCRPFAFSWDKSINGTCGSTTDAYLSVAIVNLVIDLSIVAIPMPVLWGLKMPHKQKLAISGILSLGLCICIITAARIQAVLNLEALDFTYTVVPDTIYGALEVNLGTLNACLPLLRPLFRKVSRAPPNASSNWTQKSQKNGSDGRNPWDKKWASHRLDDDAFPLRDVTTSINPVAHTGIQSESMRPGDVHIQQDVYVYSSDTGRDPV